MSKKFLCLIFLLVFALSLASCSLISIEKSGGELTEDEWNEAFDELIYSTNSTIVVALKNKLYEQNFVTENFCVQKVANGIF